MRTSLILPMMMYGRFRRERAARDEEGNTIILDRYKNGKPKYKKEKYWLIHSEKAGDPGVYPSVNHIYTRMAKGRQKLIKPAENLKERWEAEAHFWKEAVGWEMTKNEKIIIETTAYFPQDNIRRDINNIFKLLLDAFNGIIYEDDEFALPRVMDFHHVTEGHSPYFELNIYKKSEEDEITMERFHQKEEWNKQSQ